jgi:hypothetical protein
VVINIVALAHKAATSSSPTKSPTKSTISESPTVAGGCVGPFNKVKIQTTTDTYLQLLEVLVISGRSNVATRKAAVQSSTLSNYVAAYGVDGSNATFFHTRNGIGEWFQVDLSGAFSVQSVDFVNKGCLNDAGCLCRLSHANVFLLDGSGNTVSTIQLGNTCGKATITNALTQCTNSPSKQPSKVRL